MLTDGLRQVSSRPSGTRIFLPTVGPRLLQKAPSLPKWPLVSSTTDLTEMFPHLPT